MKHLLIVGVGGFAREVYWHAQHSIGYGSEWDIKGFLDGDIRLAENEYEKLLLPVYGSFQDYEIQPDDVFTCAIVDCRAREKMTKDLETRGAVFINLIHETCRIAGNVKMGRGNIFCVDVHLLDHVKIGNFVVINGRSGAGHDASIGDYSSVMSCVDITGYTQVGKRTFWGSGARAIPHSIVEDDAVIGIGSVVFKRVKAGQTVFGNPALPV